jgi:type II secretory pathway component GspD/PulD (secretin)
MKMDDPLGKGDDPARVVRALLVGPKPLLQYHEVPPGQAEPLAQLLQKVYKDDPLTMIAVVDPNSIAASAVPEWQRAIARYLRDLPRLTTEVIPLRTVEAGTTAKFLQAAFRDVSIKADESRNALTVRGTKRQIQEVREALWGQPEEGGPPAGGMRVFNVKGRAVALAKTLREILKNVRPGTKVELSLPGKKEAATPEPAPQPPPAGRKRPGKASAQVIIAVFGNKLIVTSDDRETLDFLQELVEFPTRPCPRGDDFEVIRLRVGNAVETALILDELFNGTEKEKVVPNRGGMALMLGGAPGKPRGRVDRIRVVADPSINAILVKAKPLDMLTIRSLLKPMQPEEPEEGHKKPHLLGPLKRTRAADIARIVKDLYRGTADHPAVAVDERTNSVILRCSEAVFQEVQRVVRLLESQAKPKK